MPMGLMPEGPISPPTLAGFMLLGTLGPRGPPCCRNWLLKDCPAPIWEEKRGTIQALPTAVGASLVPTPCRQAPPRPPWPGSSPLSSPLLSRLIFIGPSTQRACPQGLNPGCLTRPCLLHQRTRAAQEELRGLTAPYWLSSWLCFSWRAATVAVAVAVAVAAAAATAAAAAA